MKRRAGGAATTGRAGEAAAARRVLGAAAALLFLAWTPGTALFAQEPAPQPDLPREVARILTPAHLAGLQEEAVGWLREYIRQDTQNPPGNEIDGARFLAGILESEGIAAEIHETAPGRGNVWARLSGGRNPAVVLLHHIDVVPADRRFWSVDPLAGELRNGLIYGRGALDTKSSGILHLAAVVALHRAGVPLNRDILFMGTADEEAGGAYGAGWLVEHRPDLFEGVGYLLNEGGGGSRVGDQVNFGLEVTQKVPYWLRVTTRGEPGHGSAPRASSAVTEMISALERLRLHAFAPRLIPAVDTYFQGIAPNLPEPWRTRFQAMESHLETETLSELQLFNPGLHGLLRNTCSITRMEGSDKINVVPPEAAAELDCRLLPDQDPGEFLRELGAVLGPEAEVEVLMGFSPAVSTTDTDLYRIIEEVTLEAFPGASFVPQVLGGFTDSHFFRDLGIVSYGYAATAVPQEDGAGVHGNDERISVENIHRGVALTLEILLRLAGES